MCAWVSHVCRHRDVGPERGGYQAHQHLPPLRGLTQVSVMMYLPPTLTHRTPSQGIMQSPDPGLDLKENTKKLRYQVNTDAASSLFAVQSLVAQGLIRLGMG